MSVPDYRNFIRWFPFQEAGGNNRIDKVKGAYLSEYNGPVARSTGLVESYALDTDGGDGLIEGDYASDYDLHSDFTFGTWLYKEEGGGGEAIGKWKKYQTYAYTFGSDDSERLYLRLASSGENYDVDSYTGLGTIQNNAWNFILGWHDSVNNEVVVQCYDNSGSLRAQNIAGWSGTVQTSGIPFTVGFRGDGGPYTGGFLNARFEQMFIYDGVLTSNEISWLANGGNGRYWEELLGTTPQVITI